MKRLFLTCGALVLTLTLNIGSSPLQADTLISDFQSGVGPIIIEGGTQGVTGAITGDTEPDFDGDQSLFVHDTDGGFQNALSFNAEAFLLAFHAHSTIEFEADSVAWGGDFLNTHIVFNSNSPAIVAEYGNGFQVLPGSPAGANGGAGWAQTEDDQYYSYNFEGFGREYLNILDADHDGVVDGEDFRNFQVFIIQQGNGSTTMRYDDIQLTGVAVPEPASTSLLVLGSIFAGSVSRLGRSRRS